MSYRSWARISPHTKKFSITTDVGQNTKQKNKKQLQLQMTRELPFILPGLKAF